MVQAFLTGSSKVWGRSVLYQVQDRAEFGNGVQSEVSRNTLQMSNLHTYSS